MTQQNTAMVEQSTAAARNLADGTSDLRSQVAFFRVEGAGRSSKSRAA